MACYRTALPLLNFVTNFHVLSEGYPPKFKLPFWFTVRTLMFVGQHSLRTCIFNFWFYNVLTIHRRMCIYIYIYIYTHTYTHIYTGVGTLIVATIYLQLIQNRHMFRSFTVLQCSHQHCVQPVTSDVEVVGYL